MSAAPMPQDERQRIAQALVIARANGVKWKVLGQLYGYGRTRLWQLWHEIQAQSNRGSDDAR